eukprot:UN01357
MPPSFVIIEFRATISNNLLKMKKYQKIDKNRQIWVKNFYRCLYLQGIVILYL